MVKIAYFQINEIMIVFDGGVVCEDGIDLIGGGVVGGYMVQDLCF